jgi:hypothetical protein
MEFREISADFETNRFALRWRANCDGVVAQEFHHCCDGDANTLTLLHDMHESFLFMLENPIRHPPTKFLPHARMKDFAIACDSFCLPNFRDIIAARGYNVSHGRCFSQ